MCIYYTIHIQVSPAICLTAFPSACVAAGINSHLGSAAMYIVQWWTLQISVVFARKMSCWLDIGWFVISVSYSFAGLQYIQSSFIY